MKNPNDTTAQTNTPPRGRTMKTYAFALAAAAPLLIGSVYADPEAKTAPAKAAITVADFPDTKVKLSTKEQDQGIPIHQG